MLRILIITFLSIVFYLIEFFLFNLLGRWFTPNLLLILVVFFNLYWGIRFSLLTAFLAGFIQDSFSIDPFGSNIFTLIICAFLITLIKRYLYQIGSISSRVLMVFLVSILHVLVYGLLNAMSGIVDLRDVILYVMLPQVLITTLVANYVLSRLRRLMARIFPIV